jgi:Ankyrin repeats (3 copies)
MKFSTTSNSSYATLQDVVANDKLVKPYDDDVSTSSDYTLADDGNLSSGDDSDSSWDDDMDELMDWFNGTILSPIEVKAPKRNVSMPSLRHMATPKLFGSLGDKSSSSIILNRLGNCQAQYFQTPKSLEASSSSSESPEDCIEDIFLQHGLNTSMVKTPDALFLKTTEEHIAAHSLETTLAARQGDLAYLKFCFKEGKSLQCCNIHGESIVHIVCRRGWDNILEFLVEQAGVTPMVRDDVGRTPLHDAAWTGNPNFKLVKILLEQFPQMIHVKDTRNHTPLSYIPRQQWGAWCSFLRENQDLLLKAV